MRYIALNEKHNIQNFGVPIALICLETLSALHLFF